MAKLFQSYKLRDLEFKNKIFVSPMCQYMATDGLANNWHLVHLGSRAVGGAGLVMAEATAVAMEGRISLGDLGLWNDQQITPFIQINEFIKQQGAVPAIQLAHAGRKAGSHIPWTGSGPLDHTAWPWPRLAPSAIPFDQNWPVPNEMTDDQIQAVVDQFKMATRRSLQAGFQVVEIHMAHGYLLNEFLSPLTNQRTDQYGGHLENRLRFPLQVAHAVRQIWPQTLPVLVRLSVTEWHSKGWNENDSVYFSQKLKQLGIDLIDCSSGGNITGVSIPVASGYQVPLAEKIKKEVNISTGAVGLINTAKQAEEILQKQQADVIFIGRDFLNDPYWPLHAAKELNVDPIWPNPYLRGKK